MTDARPDDTTERFRRAADAQQSAKYVLRLYVTGMTPRSTGAIQTIRDICEEQLKDRYELEIIDLYQHPELAKEAQVIAAPTLVKELPEPLRRLIGDLSSRERVLVGLNLQAK